MRLARSLLDLTAPFPRVRFMLLSGNSVAVLRNSQSVGHNHVQVEDSTLNGAIDVEVLKNDGLLLLYQAVAMMLIKEEH